MKQKQRRILLDMDGVLADYEQGFLNVWRARYPDRMFVPLEERTTFYVKDDYPEAYKKSVEELCKGQWFYRHLPPMKGGLDAARDLLKKYEVFICTSPLSEYQNCVLEKYEWVDEHLGSDWVKRVILTKDKTLVKGDILIDDKPKIAGVVLPEWEHVLYDQPYNRSETCKRRLTWENYKTVFRR